MVWVAVVLGALAGGFLQGFTGFGAAAVIMAILPYFFNMVDAAAITQLICIALSATMTVRLIKHINLRTSVWPTVIYTVVNVIIIFFVKKIDLTVLTISFAVFLMLLCVYSLLFSGKTKVSRGVPAMFVCSALSGAFSGFFGVGGPTMALYLMEVTDDRLEYLASLQFLFFVSNLFSTGARISQGIITVSMLPLVAAGIAAILTGQFFGFRLGKKVNPKSTKTAVYLCVGLSGLLLLIQTL